MREFTIPTTYEEWRYCITVKCRLELTPDFIDARVASLGDGASPDTARFVELYGDDYRRLVLEWLERARNHSVV